MKKLLNKFYDNSPVIIQNIFVSLYGLLREHQRHGGNYKKYTRLFSKTEQFSKSDLYDYQLKELRSFLVHSYKYVPYYTNLFNQIGFKPQNISSLNDLKKIPILSKETLRKEPDLFKAKKFAQNDLLEFHTSGTTGKALTVFFEKDDFRKRIAFLERQRNWAGTKNGQKVATFTGRIITTKPGVKCFWRYNYFGKQLYFSTYHMNDENLFSYVQALENFQPLIIEGYPSAIYLISQWIYKHSYNHKIHPKAILTTGETLLDYQKEEIERVFKVQTYNYYASSEGAPFITQCKEGGLHINPESGIFEILDENGNDIFESGETGQLVVTSFLTRATPLIRYKINDSVVITNTKCKCGRNFPIVKQIIGRTDDMLYTKERGFIGRLSPAIKAFPNSVIEVQFIQNTLDEIDLFIVPDKAKFKNEHINLVLNEIKKRTGDAVVIKPLLVDQIKRGSNNKYRLTIRNFNPENIL